MNPRTNLENTFEAKMTYIPNHTFEKLKGLLALTKKNANPNLPQRSQQEWSQDLQKPQKEPQQPLYCKNKEPISKIGLQG